MWQNPFQKGIDFLKGRSNEIRTSYNASVSRMLHLTGISGLGNILLGLFKIVSGALALSVFTCVNGCYTLGMVLARYCALAGVIRTKDISKQYGYYRWSGIVLIITSSLYITYSVRMYLHPVYTAYHPYIAMGIATVTFVEIGLNLRGVLLFRKNRSPLLHAIKTINLAASLISLVLTQAAILSFADEIQNPAANGILGVLMGACAICLGIYMLLRMRRVTNHTDCRLEQKKINHMMKKYFSEYTLIAVEKEFTEQGDEVVSVRFCAGMETEMWNRICEKAEHYCRFRLRKIEESGGLAI